MCAVGLRVALVSHDWGELTRDPRSIEASHLSSGGEPMHRRLSWLQFVNRVSGCATLARAGGMPNDTATANPFACQDALANLKRPSMSGDRSAVGVDIGPSVNKHEVAYLLNDDTLNEAIAGPRLGCRPCRPQSIFKNSLRGDVLCLPHSGWDFGDRPMFSGCGQA